MRPADLPLLAGLAAIWVATRPAAAQGTEEGPDARSRPAPPVGEAPPPDDWAWRFPVGERALYDVTLGRMRVGRGELRVEAIDTIATEPAYRLSFELEGGVLFYRIDDRTVSWVAPDPIRSLRFEQKLHEGSYRRHRRYTMDHRRGTYAWEEWDEERGRFRPVPGKEALPMPPAALDEIAYLYLARLAPLEVGRSYRFDRYFEPESNPVVLEILRRETVRVPAGRFQTVVVRPVIRAGGMFGEGGRAEVYITDDDRRIIVLLRTRMRAGRLNMYLKEYEPGRLDGLIAGSGRASRVAAADGFSAQAGDGGDGKAVLFAAAPRFFAAVPRPAYIQRVEPPVSVEAPK